MHKTITTECKKCGATFETSSEWVVSRFSRFLSSKKYGTEDLCLKCQALFQDMFGDLQWQGESQFSLVINPTARDLVLRFDESGAKRDAIAASMDANHEFLVKTFEWFGIPYDPDAIKAEIANYHND